MDCSWSSRLNGTITRHHIDKGNLSGRSRRRTTDVVPATRSEGAKHFPSPGPTTYNIGTLVTKDIGHRGRGNVTTSGHPRGAMLRAYDKMTGKKSARVYMPGFRKPALR